MFHPLRVRAIERLTDDSVAVTLTVPPELRETFRHKPGQHLNVRYTVDGEEIRRSYSICAPATEAPADPSSPGKPTSGPTQPGPTKDPTPTPSPSETCTRWLWFCT